jgi:membrane protein DedA with SNARE-associated domain
MFALGRRFGAEWIRRRLRVMGEGAEDRVRRWYARFGLPALFLSRFLPAVRAVVPPLAGAIRVPPTGAIIAIAAASTLWYATLAIIAYRLSADWARISAAIARFQTTAAIVAGAIVVLGAVVWWMMRRRRRA